jgi:hypothetical protein
MLTLVFLKRSLRDVLRSALVAFVLLLVVALLVAPAWAWAQAQAAGVAPPGPPLTPSSIGGLSGGALGLVLSIGGMVSLILRQMLTDGTWPKKFQIKDPYKSVLASALGALPAVFSAKLAGAEWAMAFATGFSGLPAIVQGLMEKANPKKSDGGTDETSSSTSKDPPAPLPTRDPPT